MILNAAFEVINHCKKTKLFGMPDRVEYIPSDSYCLFWYGDYKFLLYSDLADQTIINLYIKDSNGGILIRGSTMKMIDLDYLLNDHNVPEDIKDFFIFNIDCVR